MHEDIWEVLGLTMHFENRRENDIVYLSVSGTLSFTDCRDWRRLIEAAFKEDAVAYVLDLSELEAIDSSGLGMMLNMKEWALDQRKQISIRLASDSVPASMVRLAKFDDWIVT